MATVLIGFANALAAPETVFSLLQAGHDVRAFTRRGARASILKRLPLGAPIEITPPEGDADAAAEDLRAALRTEAIDVVMGLDDVSLWLIDRAADQTPAASMVGPSLRYALDKEAQIEAARAAGLAVPPTAIVRGADDVPVDFEFPAIVKPSAAIELENGRLKKGDVHYLTRHADAANIPQLPADAPPFLMQPLIHGVGMGVFGFAGADGPTAWFGHRRVRMMNPHGSGASACAAAAPDDDLKAAAERFIRAIAWRGPFMIELLRGADGTPWFMELNGRLWGSTALARRMGFEYPAWAVAQALDPSFRPTPPAAAEGMEIRHLGRDLLHLLFVLRGPKSDFHRVGWPKFLGSMARVLTPVRPSRYYNFDPSFPTFFLKDAAETVMHALRRGR